MELKNSDGIVSTLFHYIWKRPDTSMTKFRINIPHTIIFHEYSPAYWYFSNKNGEISKRYESSITTEMIYKALTKKGKRTDVVAIYLSVRKEFNRMTYDFEDELFQPEGLDKVATVEYITKSSLSINLLELDELLMGSLVLFQNRGFHQFNQQSQAWDTPGVH